jgi:hypothetical protein
MPVKEDIKNNKYNRLLVIKCISKDKWGKRLWLCRCDCGGETITTSYRLKSGHTKSCGYFSKETIGNISRSHGKSKTGTYRSWTNMKNRCLNENIPEYKRYGERGIKICDRWLKSFENFFEDMGERPKGMSIERKDNSGNYCKENCKWANDIEQANNKRNNFIIKYNNENYTLGKLSRLLSINRTTIKYRFLHNIPIDAIDMRFN